MEARESILNQNVRDLYEGRKQWITDINEKGLAKMQD